MSREDWGRLEPLLDRLLDLPPAERFGRVDEIVSGDEELGERLRSMLAAADRGGILDESVSAIAAGVLLPEDGVDAPSARLERIGPYRVVRELGRGGMGEVLLAERADGEFEQLVALKIVRAELNREGIVERFRRERRILARLRHPNIAQLYDGGATGDGIPYFAMEYVEGEPITDWCDGRRLSVPERAALFEALCGAVQYAHQSLVIHRDIKPGNVFVTSDGTPKLLDFGIGKLLDPSDDDPTSATGAFLTPAFAAPEQIRGEPTSTTADVFSLGALLYLLLTGHAPHGETSSRERLATAARREEEVPRPSSRAGVATSRTSGEEIARLRGAADEDLRRSLQGDLDNILLKALEADPADRYATAEDLRADLERYRLSLPIRARAAATGYRLRKFVHRHRVGVAGGVAVVLAVASGVGGVAWQAGVAARERDRAEAALERERVRTRELQQVADFQADQLSDSDVQEIGERLREHVLTYARESGTNVTGLDDLNFTSIAASTLREDMRRTIERIDESFSDQPAVVAQLLQTVAVALQNLGLFEDSFEPQRRALEIRRTELGDSDPATLDSVNNMGFQLSSEGKYDEAETLYREALAGFRRVLGPDDRRTLEAAGNLASVLTKLGRLEAAEPLSREAVEGARRVLAPGDPDAIAWITNHASLLRRMERLEEAEPYYREALDETRAALGDDHPHTWTALNNMGFLLKGQGRHEEAEPFYRQALEGYRRVLGDDHPQVLIPTSNLGGLLRDLGRFEEADELGTRAVNGPPREPAGRALARGSRDASAWRDASGDGAVCRRRSAIRRGAPAPGGGAWTRASTNGPGRGADCQGVRGVE